LSEPLFHLAEPRAWAAATDEYTPASLETEGFIHCSTGEQLSRTARRFYTDRNDMVLLTIDPEPISGKVRYEDLYDSGEEFPHVYGPIPTSAVRTTGPYLNHLEEGLWLDAIRGDRGWMDRILHPDFIEVGMSGRTHTRDQVLSADHDGLEADVPLDGYRMDLVDEDVALVRYVSRDHTGDETRVAERSSLWINTNEGWRLRYHQGTPLPRA
jgi:uncharacterized protein (DUF952 family)